ncbi:DUF2520 domain-containing protein [Pedobacter polaris]|uniref:DUF2520 domain-containing protein n=1 Tax=Pedobacter polaris TaxID=2571273 RepID=A0A4V5NZU4_9SPHI|nr:DUF2520 domain-containing protein [Pedobacter polaris]TKC08325.1 DUF2520 domain-containing protein [Pedobacter polaris]
MKVVIIGAGNVATHIAKALKAVNVQISQVWSYHYENALLLANEINAIAVKDLAELDNDADIYLISVKDDAIAELVKHLSLCKGIIVHTSGSVNIDVFVDLTAYGVFYPLQTFSKNKEVDFSNIPLCLEANDGKTLAILKDVASRLSNNVLEVSSEKRKILHLAAVFACNFTNHLYAMADEILKANELAFDIIRPLIAETANKVQNALPAEVQTGPAIREDKETIEKHEELLKNQPELLEIYKTLSESIKKTR